MKVALYARVSTTNGQTTETQLTALREAAQRHGWDIVHEYVDHGISGAKGRDQRPQFDALCKAATRKEFDLIAAWSVDRLGRSLADLVSFLSELHAKNIDLYRVALKDHRRQCIILGSDGKVTFWQFMHDGNRGDALRRAGGDGRARNAG